MQSNFEKYRNKETGEIVEHDGMLFMTYPPQIKFLEGGEVKMMPWPKFLEQYQLIENDNDK
jgi:hypothetical protein